MKYLILISLGYAFSILSLSCSKVSNSYNPTVVECGISALEPDTELVQVPGQNAESMSVFLLTPDRSQSLKVTDKGCVLVPKSASPESEVLFKSNLEAYRLAELLPHNALLERKTLKLRDLSTHKVKLGCSSASPGNAVVNTRDHFEIWSEVSSDQDLDSAPSRHFHFEYGFISNPEHRVRWKGARADVSVEGMEEGTHKLEMVAYLKAFPDVNFVQDCTITKDKTPPAVTLPSQARHYQNMDPSIVQVLPAENLNLEIQEANSFALKACWQELSATSDCMLEAAGKNLLAPSQGSWILRVRAEDGAGNVQNTQWPVVVYEKDKINAILQAALSTQLLAESKRWIEGLKLITRTAAEWMHMPHHAELKDVENQLRAAFINIFLDRAPSLIVFENKQNVEYVGANRFFHAGIKSVADREVLKLEMHDFSNQTATHFHTEVSRKPGLGDARILHGLDHKKYVLVRTDIHRWKVLDQELREWRTIHIPTAAKEDSLIYFPDFEQAILKVGDYSFPVSADGKIHNAAYSNFDEVYLSDSGISLFSLKHSSIWSPDGQLLFNGRTFGKKLTNLPYVGKPLARPLFAAYSCDSERMCDLQLIYPEINVEYATKTVRVPGDILADAQVSWDRNWLLYKKNSYTVGLCSFQTGTCSDRTFPEKILDICMDAKSREWVVLAMDNLYKGPHLESAVASDVFTGRYRNEFGRCQTTERGVVLKSFEDTLTLFDGKETPYKSEIDFTYDGIYALETGLNSSQMRVWSTSRHLYDTQSYSSTSMGPEKQYFSAHGDILSIVGDFISVFDLVKGSRLNSLEQAIQAAGEVRKVLKSQDRNELIVQFRDKVSKFNIADNHENILFSSSDPILDAVNSKDGYLLISSKEVIQLRDDETSAVVSHFSLPIEQGSPQCSTYSATNNVFYFLDNQGSLLRLNALTGNIRQARLDFGSENVHPQIWKCQLHWNDADASLYIAIDGSMLWHWNETIGDKARVVSEASGAELGVLNSTSSGKIVLVGYDMAYDKVQVYDPSTGVTSQISVGIDIRGGWVDYTTKITYLVGFNGEIVALDPDIEGRSSILWKIETGRNLHGIHVAEGERSLAFVSYGGELLSLHLDLTSLLKKSCEWLKNAAALDKETERYCR